MAEIYTTAVGRDLVQGLSGGTSKPKHVPRESLCTSWNPWSPPVYVEMQLRNCMGIPHLRNCISLSLYFVEGEIRNNICVTLIWHLLQGGIGKGTKMRNEATANVFPVFHIFSVFPRGLKEERRGKSLLMQCLEKWILVKLSLTPPPDKIKLNFSWVFFVVGFFF